MTSLLGMLDVTQDNEVIIVLLNSAIDIESARNLRKNNTKKRSRRPSGT